MCLVESRLQLGDDYTDISEIEPRNPLLYRFTKIGRGGSTIENRVAIVFRRCARQAQERIWQNPGCSVRWLGLDLTENRSIQVIFL